MDEIIRVEPNVQEIAVGPVGEDLAPVLVAVNQLAQAMQSMGDMMRMTGERMSAMERELKLLTPVTGVQKGAIHTAIRERAAELCESYHAAGCEKSVCAAIRRELRLQFGINNISSLPRCEYQVAMQSVALWDDYKAMKGIKAKANG